MNKTHQLLSHSLPMLPFPRIDIQKYFLLFLWNSLNIFNMAMFWFSSSWVPERQCIISLLSFFLFFVFIWQSELCFLVNDFSLRQYVWYSWRISTPLFVCKLMGWPWAKLSLLTRWLTLFFPTFSFDPPEKIRKPLVFWCFKGIKREDWEKKG